MGTADKLRGAAGATDGFSFSGDGALRYENAAGAHMLAAGAVRQLMDDYLRQLVIEGFKRRNIDKLLDAITERRLEVAVNKTMDGLEIALQKKVQESMEKRIADIISTLPVDVDIKIGKPEPIEVVYFKPEPAATEHPAP